MFVLTCRINIRHSSVYDLEYSNIQHDALVYLCITGTQEFVCVEMVIFRASTWAVQIAVRVSLYLAVVVNNSWTSLGDIGLSKSLGALVVMVILRSVIQILELSFGSWKKWLICRKGEFFFVRILLRKHIFLFFNAHLTLYLQPINSQEKGNL